jgi:predicted DsbA family dithiol-disulfide isomerase
MVKEPVLEVYSSIECPYAYLAAFRLKQIQEELAGKMRVTWKALSLEYINRQPYPKPLHQAEYELFRQIEPDLPWNLWDKPDWEWPTTFLPAFEALACAQEQGSQEASEMSWALRHAYFAERRNISMRHELVEIARRLEEQGGLNYDQFVDDWDGGRFRRTILEESRQGWHIMKLEGSATLILPDGMRITNPAVGEIDLDEEAVVLRSFSPYPGDPILAYREILKI